MRGLLFLAVYALCGDGLGRPFLRRQCRARELRATETRAEEPLPPPPNANLVSATTVGGALLGLSVGGLLDGALANGEAPWLPFSGSLLVGGGSLYAASEAKGRARALATALLGSPTLAATAMLRQAALNQMEITKRGIKSKVDEKVDTVKKIPTVVAAKIEDSIQVGQRREINR